MERAAIQAAQRDKTVKGLTRQASAASGSAATRIEAFFYSKGSQSFLQDPEIDAWYLRQSTERDRKKRRSYSTRFSRRPTMRPASCPSGSRAFPCASGSRVAVSGLSVKSVAYSAPYEDVQLST